MSFQNRISAMTPMMPWRGAYVDAADTGFTQGNRQGAAWMYSGILATVAQPTEDVVTANIITTGTTLAARTTVCDQLQIMVGQAQGPSATRSHSISRGCGRTLGVGRRLGQV